MAVLPHLVRVAGALSACALLTAAGPAGADPVTPAAPEIGNSPAISLGQGATADSGTAAGNGVAAVLAQGVAAAMAGGIDPRDTAAAVTALAGATATAAPTDWLAAYGETVKGLQQLGIQPFLYPTAAPYCLTGTTLGLAPAVAGAIPGPWPEQAIAVPGLDLSAVKAGQTMYAFVPYGVNADGADTSGMQVVWLNLDTGRSGFAPMGTLAQVVNGMIPEQVPLELRPMVEQAVAQFFAGALPRGGVRAVPVDTGSGTVLAAMFGVVRNGENSCFFFPTVGLTPVP